MHHEPPIGDFAIGSDPEEELERLRSTLQTQAIRYEALQTSETYFRHLTEFSLDLITILDADGTIRFESRSIETELGYPPEYYRGRNAFEFVHPDDRAAVWQSFSEALTRRGSTPVIRFRFRHVDGSYRLLEGRGNNLLDDPAVRGIVFNSRDITERVQMQEMLDCNRVEKEETVARLTGGVAHDFNNILTAILGFTDLTAAGLPASNPGAEYLVEIRKATERAASLTRQLLAISRRMVLEPRALSIGPWLRQLEPRLAGLLGSDIELTLVTNGELHVWEDPAQLEQVLLQLATNAREATAGGGRFTVEARLTTSISDEEMPGDKNQYVELIVADQGSGMTEATLARVFEPFFTTKTTGHHPGLGLSMCRGIVEQSGGHLRVHSHPGRGTIFHLYLPMAVSPVQIPTPPSEITPTAPAIPTILFVDDEPMVRQLGATILEGAGYKVLIAEDGPSALVKIDELGDTRLDMLVSDVIMPGMNGMQLAEIVMERRPGTPVMLCSGYTDDIFKSKGLPLGVSFLSKPFKLSVLLERIASTLKASA